MHDMEKFSKFVDIESQILVVIFNNASSWWFCFIEWDDTSDGSLLQGLYKCGEDSPPGRGQH